jgi:hypothetical protein
MKSGRPGNLEPLRHPFNLFNRNKFASFTSVVLFPFDFIAFITLVVVALGGVFLGGKLIMAR